MQTIGKFTVKVGGMVLDTMPGAKLNLGGNAREPTVGANGLLGFSEKYEPGMLDCTVALKKGQSLKALDFSDKTVTVIADSGQAWSGANAFLTKTLEATAENGGNIPLVIACDKFEEITG